MKVPEQPEVARSVEERARNVVSPCLDHLSDHRMDATLRPKDPLSTCARIPLRALGSTCSGNADLRINEHRHATDA